MGRGAGTRDKGRPSDLWRGSNGGTIRAAGKDGSWPELLPSSCSLPKLAIPPNQRLTLPALVGLTDVTPIESVPWPMGVPVDLQAHPGHLLDSIGGRDWRRERGLPPSLASATGARGRQTPPDMALALLRPGHACCIPEGLLHHHTTSRPCIHSDGL
ncbi:hypothetical protein BO79DRAFT_291467 [Aspergillus costaricaensis CBS 115574]|uniref:Uncharacterized protein n=1 Tax=Aspergillus costaricaensis CBS 115574 TaxID=1448317 RepID=A0ACD1HXW1_9EURO|nr:hypothetical protein BO79DRAFT_291467 [Aspergillus costaricaensis CBS 115574]RAK83080.1 hypothetical protein BO79DRAFT_291467 [Aspergillus costaricaensis CBS 115574]